MSKKHDFFKIDWCPVDSEFWFWTGAIIGSVLYSFIPFGLLSGFAKQVLGSYQHSWFIYAVLCLMFFVKYLINRLMHSVTTDKSQKTNELLIRNTCRDLDWKCLQARDHLTISNKPWYINWLDVTLIPDDGKVLFNFNYSDIGLYGIMPPVFFGLRSFVTRKFRKTLAKQLSGNSE